MTPAIQTAKAHGCDFSLHEYDHDPAHESFGQEAAEALSAAPEQIFKTLVVALDTGKLGVALVPVSETLSLKRAASALGGKKARMATPQIVQNKTGYVLGGVSPLGQKTVLPTVIDRSAEQWASVFVSGGRRGLEIELSPGDLAAMTRASFAELAR